MGWTPADSIGVALFNYDGGASGSGHLSLTVGDLLYVLEEQSGWFRGYLYYQPSQIGLFPANFVEIKESVSAEVGRHHRVIPSGNEVALEAAVALKEWQPRLVEYYVNGQSGKFRQLLHYMESVMSQRRNIIHSTATLDVLQSMRTKLTAQIDTINHQLECPLTPRDSQGAIVNCRKSSAQKLFQIHEERARELAARVTQTGSLQRKTLSSLAHSPHLFVQINHVDHTFPEPCEIYMFLYDTDITKQLTERLYLNSEDRKSPSERPCALFTDLSMADVQSRNIFLVCQIIRKGKMLLDDKKNISESSFRRPYACGILDVSSVLQYQPETEATAIQNEDLKSYNLPLYLCSANHESDFSTFHDKIVVKMGGKGGQKPGCSILLSLKLFRGELSQLRRDFSLTLTKSMHVVHKLGFPDIILPGDVRNDIYITLECGQFEKGHKRSERNVEVSIEVVDGGGQTIPRSIILGAGAAPTGEYESFIFYHNNYPRWNETIKLSIPFEKLPDTHLRITFRHVAKNESRDKAEKTFAFTYLKIMNDDGSIIKDALHELYVYKAEGNKRWYDPKVYLSELSRKEDITRRGSKSLGPSRNLSVSDVSYTGSSMVARSFKEYIQLSTLTCSTKLTQKIELLMLLKWRQKQHDLGVVLTNLMCVDGEEVVKFLQDTLDSLFEILNTNQEMYGTKVFDVLVFIFGLLLDERYQHFTTVLDIYITKHFSALLSHKFLVWVFSKCLRELPPVGDQHPRLVRVIQAMRYIFKFMAQSHVLFARQNKREDETFKDELREVFSILCTLMSTQEKTTRNICLIQSAVLKNLPNILPEIVQVLPETELASLISRFLNSVRNTQGTIPRDKMEFVQAVLDSPVALLHSPESRCVLLPTLVKVLVDHLDIVLPRTSFKAEEPSNTACMTCVGGLLGKLSEGGLNTGPQDIEHLIPLLYPVLRLCKQLPKSNPLHGMNSVNLIGLLDAMEDTHYTSFFGTQKDMYGNELKVTLMDFMDTLKGVINGKLFPKTWVSMYFMQNRVISRALHNISTALTDNFLRPIVFTPSVWDHYFSLCRQFIVQPSLQIEQFRDYRQTQYQQQFGDMRLSVGSHVMSMWHRLKEQKAKFIPDLIGPFLEMTLIKQPDLRRTTLPVVFDIIRCEQATSGNFKRVETEIFDKMDDLLFKGRGDEEYKEMFSDILTAESASSKDLAQSGTAFIDLVSRLIGMLLDYRSVAADDSCQARRMGCMLNLLNFYKEIEKHELYVRYIYKLSELHEKNHSYTEAGFTLLLHARELEWSSSSEESVAAVGRYPDQTSLQRKEQLYMDSVRLFNEGKSWECGIPLCKELATLYETDLYNYTKLASILKKQAMFHERIIDLQELRVASEYFMVGYYGRGFPLFLRNKVFVHRGQPYEKLTSFIKRLTDEFVSAQILRTVTPPDNDIQNSSGMHLQVRSVQAIPEEQPQLKGKQVPDRIIEYYKSNEVQRFTYDRPFHKGKKNKECEFASLWLERTTFTTDQKLPGVISWFEVSSTDTVEMDPLAIALETVSSKNSEIQTMVDQYKVNSSLNINPLSMQLNGVIDAAVMGGVANYDKIFFNDEHTKQHPENSGRVKHLRELIEEQTKVLAQGLLLHSQRIDPSLRGLHEKLEQCFQEFQMIVYPERKAAALAKKATVARSKTLSRPLPPAPSIGSPSSGSATLANLKRPIRRATGKPSNKISTRPPSQSIYEETEFLPVAPVKRSVSNITSARSPAPSQPPPRLGSSPIPIKKRLSASMSSGGSSEQLEAGNNNRSSLVSSGGSADDITDTYEPIQDYLTGSSVPIPETSVRMSRISMTMGDAPNYPAPPPPEVEDDDEGYTQVNVIPGGGVTSTFTHSSEWAELPLKIDRIHNKSRSPEPTNRMSSSPQGPTNRMSSSPQGTSPKMAATKQVRAVVPPEPTTPPPSPPLTEATPTQSRPPEPLIQQSLVESEGPKLPPKKQKRSLLSDPGNDISMATNLAQPEDNVYFDHLVTGSLEKTTPILDKTTPTIIEAPQEPGVYFDHLVGPLPAKQITNQNTASSHVTLNQNEDNVYFDHLVIGKPDVKDQRSLPEQPESNDDAVYVLAGPPSEPPPRLPSKSDKPLPPPPSQELQSPPTSPTRKLAPSIPKSQKPLPGTPPDDSSVYFDHLPGPPATSLTRKLAPSIPKSQKPLPETPPDDSSVYFDHLPGPPATSLTRKPVPSIPKTQKLLPETPPDDVYFPGPPAPRAKMASPLKKKWPPGPDTAAKPPGPDTAAKPTGPDTAAAPPLPVKKRQTIQRKVSEPPEEVPRPLEVQRPLDEPQPPGRPVPRPRTGTLKKSEFADAPPRPPKASSSIPSLPPKPKQHPPNGEKPAPPVPFKSAPWKK